MVNYKSFLFIFLLCLLYPLICFSDNLNELRPVLTRDKLNKNEIEKHPDKIIDTKTIKATFVDLEHGDYIHLIFKVQNGKKISLFATDDHLTYFILAHKEKPLDISYQVVESWIPESGGYQSIQKIFSARRGSLDYKHWWKQECNKSSESKLIKKYEKLLEKILVR